MPYQELEKSQSEHEKTLTDVYTDMIQLLKFSDKDKSMIIKNDLINDEFSWNEKKIVYLIKEIEAIKNI